MEDVSRASLPLSSARMDPLVRSTRVTAPGPADATSARCPELSMSTSCTATPATSTSTDRVSDVVSHTSTVEVPTVGPRGNPLPTITCTPSGCQAMAVTGPLPTVTGAATRAPCRSITRTVASSAPMARREPSGETAIEVAEATPFGAPTRVPDAVSHSPTSAVVAAARTVSETNATVLISAPTSNWRTGEPVAVANTTMDDPE